MIQESRKAVLVEITGRVQGVGYRNWTVREAQKRKVAGYVRNRQDGKVEALFEGDTNAVDAMIEACRKGPVLARIDRLEISEVSLQAAGQFEIR